MSIEKNLIAAGASAGFEIPPYKAGAQRLSLCNLGADIISD